MSRPVYTQRAGPIGSPTPFETAAQRRLARLRTRRRLALGAHLDVAIVAIASIVVVLAGYLALR